MRVGIRGLEGVEDDLAFRWPPGAAKKSNSPLDCRESDGILSLVHGIWNSDFRSLRMVDASGRAQISCHGSVPVVVGTSPQILS